MLRTLVSRIELVPNGDELAIVLRGDLAAILRFAAGKKEPTFLEHKAVLEELMGEAAVSVVKNTKTLVRSGTRVLQASVVAGA